MRKLFEIFKVLQFQKRIVAAATIWGNTVYENFHIFHFQKRIVSAETIRGNTVGPRLVICLDDHKLRCWEIIEIDYVFMANLANYGALKCGELKQGHL